MQPTDDLLGESVVEIVERQQIAFSAEGLDRDGQPVLLWGRHAVCAGVVELRYVSAGRYPDSNSGRANAFSAFFAPFAGMLLAKWERPVRRNRSSVRRESVR